tara:strand:+ start:1269 stop:1811 length:543 start_codon:yes stop_codon:yes gene_type:complete
MLRIVKNHKLLLVVDDDSDYVARLEEVLVRASSDFNLEHTEELPKINNILAKDYDVVFLDLVMSDASPDQVFNLCKELSPHVPVIIVSPTEDKGIIEKSIDNGSHAFIVKENIDSRYIVHTISKAIDRFDVSKKKENSKLLEFKRAIEGLERKLKAPEHAQCSHAECRLNEAIHRLKLMA